MSRDFRVYSRKPKPLPMEEILAALQSRGVTLRWEPDSQQTAFSSFIGAAEGLIGHLSAENRDDPQAEIRISAQYVGEEERRDLIESYADVLTEAHRQTLSQALTKYSLSTVYSADADRDRAFVTLLDLLAELTDGLILDLAADRFYDRIEYQNISRDSQGP